MRVRAGALIGAVVLVAGTAAVNVGGTAGAASTAQTFVFTGDPQSFTVPTGVCALTVDVLGAQGAQA